MAKAVLVLVMVAAILVASDGAITCNQVTGKLMQCASFLVGSAAKPSGPCCAGVKSLNSMAKSTPDRQATCGCLKNAAGSYGINLGNAKKLPGACGVNVGVPIDPSVNCAK
eukprot:Gb_02342 [translate_table: standard]